MATSDRDRALREAFRFDAGDLAANRAGRISPRQDALLGAGRRGMLLSLAVFAAVMVGSVGLVAFFDRQLADAGRPGRHRGGSRRRSGRHRRRLPPEPALPVGRRLPEAERGPGSGRGRVGLRERLPGAVRADVAAPARSGRPLGRSSRVRSTASTTWRDPWRTCCPRNHSPAGRRPGGPAAETATDAAEHETASAQIGIVRRGYVIVVLIGLLALGIPLAGFFVRDLPGPPAPLRVDRAPRRWRVGFVWFAISWLDPGKRRRS